MIKRFTDEEKDLIFSLYQTKSNVQISRVINRSNKQIANFLWTRKIKRDRYPMNDEWRKNISKGITGRKLSMETKRKLSLRAKEQFKNGMPEATKKKISISLSGKNNYFYGKHHTPETRLKMRLYKLGKANPKHSQKLKKLYAEGKIHSWIKGKHHSEETRKKIGLNSKAFGFFKRKNKNPEFIKKRLKGLIKKPTKPEKKMIRLLNTNFPNEWKYVGNGQIIIDNLNPDFINCNGKKLIIEVFGDYWHDPQRHWVLPLQEREKRFKKYGYNMLMLKESDLINEEEVINKIRCFENAYT